MDPTWRGKMVTGIHNGIHAWILNDAADAQLRRNSDDDVMPFHARESAYPS